MVSLNSNLALPQDAQLKLQKEKEVLMLKIMLNNLAADYKAAEGNPQVQDSIKFQIDNLAQTLGGGTYEQVTDQALPGVNATNAGIVTGGKADAGYTKFEGVVDKKQGKEIIADLEAELAAEVGVTDTGSGDAKRWMAAAKTSDKVNIVDAAGNNIEANEHIKKKGAILEFHSQKHGVVKVQLGGDGELNGGDDKVIEYGGKAAAGITLSGLNALGNNNTAAGLQNNDNLPLNEQGNVLFEKAACPICKGAGCPACTGQGVTLEKYNALLAKKGLAPQATVTHAQDVAASPAVAQVAATNPLLGPIVTQVQDSYNMTDTEIKNLIAAIMQIVNKNAA